MPRENTSLKLSLDLSVVTSCLVLPGDVGFQVQVDVGRSAIPLLGPALLHLVDGGQRAASAGA